jgi:hypothetical protein
MTRTYLNGALGFLAVLGLLTGTAHANLITGDLWHVPESVVGFGGTGAIPANVPGTPPDVTFSVNSPLNFNATDATVGTWLASGLAFNIVENTPGTLLTLMDDGTTGTILDFKGMVSVTHNEQFTVTHDDGLTLIIGGVNLGFSPFPTSPITTLATYTGPSGNFPFELVYGECCGGPAVLQVDLPFSEAVPEPSTLALFGAGLVAFAFFIRRRYLVSPHWSNAAA